MNLQEFNALRVHDVVENPMSTSRGTVIEASERGVRIRWGEAEGAFNGFLYTVDSTAWFHWVRPVQAIETREDGIS